MSSRKPVPICSTANGFDADTIALPANEDAERFVLGSILLDETKFDQTAALAPNDFSIERHRRIFAGMQDLRCRGEHIDRVTLAEELERRRQLGPDGLSYIASLDDGIPQIPHLDAYVKIVQDKSLRRQVITSAREVQRKCLDPGAEPHAFLGEYATQIAAMSAAVPFPARTKVRRVDDLDSVFAKRQPLEYIVKPELPVKAIVTLSGDPESGKTTLAFAWARDAWRNGHAVLILDRDKNPRDRICDRLERLGLDSDGERFRVWDSEQEEEAPQPDDHRIQEWVKQNSAQTEKSPVVVVDSLVAFFDGKEDENSAIHMRAVFNRCRVLTKLGATVILIHHTNRNGDARGSSDFKAASDQAFLVKKANGSGGRRLDVFTLDCQKSRYGLSDPITYHYAGGAMTKTCGSSGTAATAFIDLLKAHPGVVAGKFEELASRAGLGRNKARAFLRTGAQNGTIEVRPHRRSSRHYWSVAAGATGDDSGCVAETGMGVTL